MKNSILLLVFILTTNILLGQRQPIIPFTPDFTFDPIVVTPCFRCDLSNVNINFNYTTVGCEVYFATFLANLPGNCGGVYSYTFGDGSPESTGHPADPTCAVHQYNGNGTFEACMTYEVNPNCSISECINVAVLDCDDCSICNLTVNPLTIDSNNGNEVSFGGGETYFNDSCTNWTKQYDYGDGTTGTSDDHTYSSAGAYNVCITSYVTSPNNLTCSETACDNLNVGLTSEESKEMPEIIKNARLKPNNDLSIFPNPVKDKVNINLGSQNIKDMSLISLTDFNGKTLFLEKIDQTKDVLNIDVSNLPIGIYFVKFESIKGETMYKKIQKI